MKLYYCQLAGAVGVIFVDWDPEGRFTVMPRIENGPIYPNGPSLTVNIPCMLTLQPYAGALQEDALHSLVFAPPNCVGVPEGWRIGFIFCRRQVRFVDAVCEPGSAVDLLLVASSGAVWVWLR